MIGILYALFGLLQTQDITREDAHFGLYIQLLVHQCGFDPFLCRLFFSIRLIIVGHRDNIIGVRRINLMRLLIASQSLLHLLLFQMQIAHDQWVAGLHRELCRQLLDLLEGLCRLLQLIVQPIFLHRERFIHPDPFFQRIQGIDRLTDLARLGQCVSQVIVQLLLLRKIFH